VEAGWPAEAVRLGPAETVLTPTLPAAGLLVKDASVEDGNVVLKTLPHTD
jgi:hypothetical protein